MAKAEQFQTINKPKDWSRLTEVERSHVPMIQMPEYFIAGQPVNVTISVGQLWPYPNEPQHHIQWLELYANDVFLMRVELTPVLTQPQVTIPLWLEKPGTIRAVARCNLHGDWESTWQVEMRQAA